MRHKEGDWPTRSLPLLPLLPLPGRAGDGDRSTPSASRLGPRLPPLCAAGDAFGTGLGGGASLAGGVSSVPFLDSPPGPSALPRLALRFLLRGSAEVLRGLRLFCTDPSRRRRRFFAGGEPLPSTSEPFAATASSPFLIKTRTSSGGRLVRASAAWAGRECRAAKAAIAAAISSVPSPPPSCGGCSSFSA